MNNKDISTANKYTPATIDKSFEIPLYQRLFEWTESEIKQLLNDLHSSFELSRDNPKPYYIGMLTVHNDSLVDGQQRFTVLNLMGIAFETENWRRFVKMDEERYRLIFFARKKDSEYLKRIFEKISNNEKENYVNKKMENGIKTIKQFIDLLEGDDDYKESFKNYVYNNATFFISELPKEYTPQDLNRYFESMNASGKGLENHEILKVDLLKKLTKDKILYTKIWNAVSEMDKCLIRPLNKDETTEYFRVRVQKALNQLFDLRELVKQCKDINTDNNNNEDSENHPSIKDIPSSSKRPSISYNTRSEKSIINFTEFLLQVLWLQLSEEDRGKTINFFNTYKLQETFKKHLKDDDVEKFFNNLLKYRILFDNFIVRIRNNEGNDTNYYINFNEENNDNEVRKQIIQYQSMLYVSTSSHIWLTKMLEFVKVKPSELSAEKFITQIKEYDNERWNSKLDLSKLTYGSIDRYWFWRLDYYLWEKRNDFFENKNLKIVENYLFKTNRSIEHLHPQNPSIKSKEDWANNLDLFGNLAMISTSFNSTQSNDDENIKFARIENQLEGKMSLESIKLLLMYVKAKVDSDGWNISKADKHADEMFEFLKKSFEKQEEIL